VNRSLIEQERQDSSAESGVILRQDALKFLSQLQCLFLMVLIELRPCATAPLWNFFLHFLGAP
jgi:hypothetical protein